MNKLWLTLITGDREKDIDELTKDTFDYFDGIVAVEHESRDNTREILESRKKAGKIITRSFVRHHGFSMNEFLFAGVIKNLDYFLIVDSPERIQVSWLKQLRGQIDLWVKEGVNGVYMDRIYLARYFDDMAFFGGIHWGLANVRQRVIQISLPKENYIINTRDVLQSAFLHPCKYYYCYGDPGQMQIMYTQFGEQVYTHHANLRMQFRLHCQFDLGLDFTLNSLEEYMLKGVYSDFFENMLELETNLKDFFRIKVLKQSWQELEKNRHNFSYFRYKRDGAVNQGINDGYEGVFNKYLRSIGQPTQ